MLGPDLTSTRAISSSTTRGGSSNPPPLLARKPCLDLRSIEAEAASVRAIVRGKALLELLDELLRSVSRPSGHSKLHEKDTLLRGEALPAQAHGSAARATMRAHCKKSRQKSRALLARRRRRREEPQDLSARRRRRKNGGHSPQNEVVHSRYR